MGRSIDPQSTVVKLADVARVRNTQQQRNETQRRQFSLTLQQEAAEKEKQVQTSNKSESSEAQKKVGKEKKHNPRKRRSKHGDRPESEETAGEREHIDISID